MHVENWQCLPIKGSKVKAREVIVLNDYPTITLANLILKSNNSMSINLRLTFFTPSTKFPELQIFVNSIQRRQTGHTSSVAQSYHVKFTRRNVQKSQYPLHRVLVIFCPHFWPQMVGQMTHPPTVTISPRHRALTPHSSNMEDEEN